jgi:hypothetical protein
MQMLKPRFSIPLAVGVLSLLIYSPSALAQQQMTDIEVAPQPARASGSRRVVTTSAQQAGERPGVRYTTGYTESSGWEQSLVKGQPNLGRWNWSPIVSYTQSVGSRPTGKGASAAPSIVPRTSHYVKYNHCALPVAAQPSVNSYSAESNSHGSVSGHTMNRTTLTYGENVHGTAFYASPMTSTDVRGVIRSR